MISEDSSKKTGSAGKKTGGNIASMFAKQVHFLYL